MSNSLNSGLKVTQFSEKSWLVNVPVTSISAVVQHLNQRPLFTLSEWVAGDQCFLLLFKIKVERTDITDYFRSLEKPITIQPSVLHTIPVKYNGPDLAEVASKLSMSVEQLVEYHSSIEYKVEFLGFSPGFGYLTGGSFDAIERRGIPRKKMARGAVAIAAGYTCVYPAESAGGWNWIGNTDTRLFDEGKDGNDMFLFKPNDRVTFELI